MTMHRRLFLRTLMAAGALPFAPPAWRRLRELRVRALGDGFYEVEGWILTAADVDMLNHHVS